MTHIQELQHCSNAQQSQSQSHTIEAVNFNLQAKAKMAQVQQTTAKLRTFCYSCPLNKTPVKQGTLCQVFLMYVRTTQHLNYGG